MAAETKLGKGSIYCWCTEVLENKHESTKTSSKEAQILQANNIRIIRKIKNKMENESKGKDIKERGGSPRQKENCSRRNLS